MVAAQMKENYPGQYAPDILDAVTEYCLEENPQALDKTLANAKAEKQYVNAEIVCIDIGDAGQDAIRRRLCEPMTIKATVEE